MPILDTTGAALLDTSGATIDDTSSTLPWAPGDPWPGTPGGAHLDIWGPYVRVYLRAAIGTGYVLEVGPPDTQDRLDAGNVLGFELDTEPDEPFWIDLSSRCTGITVTGGCTSPNGILSQADAATLNAEIWDPEANLDPLNPDSVWTLGDLTRLVPGVPIECFAEVVNPTTTSIYQSFLFTGTADKWGETWRMDGRQRLATLQATDATKLFNKMNHPEQPAVGAGDTTTTRMARIVGEFGWDGVIVNPPNPPAATNLQATTLAKSAWEMLKRAADDELGMVFVTRAGALRWTSRYDWFDTATTGAVVNLGLLSDVPFGFDIVTSAEPASFDQLLINSVYAANTGGLSQHKESTSSVDTFGEQSVNRTDLGMASDPDAAAWALALVQLYSYPQVSLSKITLRPVAAEPFSYAAYRQVLAAGLITSIVHVAWHPSDAARVVDVYSRIVGYTYTISPSGFDVEWRLADANLSKRRRHLPRRPILRRPARHPPRTRMKG